MIVAILATYFATVILVESEGPFGIFYKFRNLKAVRHYGVLACALCTSFNISLLAALTISTDFTSYALNVFAIAGAVTIIDRAVENVL